MSSKVCGECHGRGKIERLRRLALTEIAKLFTDPVSKIKPREREIVTCWECGGVGFIDEVIMSKIRQPGSKKLTDWPSMIRTSEFQKLMEDVVKDAFLTTGISPFPINQYQKGMIDLSDKVLSQQKPPPPDEEGKFKRWWEEEQMAKGWRSWGGNINESVAKVWLDEGRGCLCSRFPYKLEVIDELREKVPKGKKSWNATDKMWEFSIETIDVIVDIFTRHFDKVLDLTKATAPMEASQQTDPLLSILDEADKTAIHRMLAMKYHPDRAGGDEEKMARINQVFSGGKKGERS